MNENIDLTTILKDCPKGFKLYSPIYGICEFGGFNTRPLGYPIRVNTLFGDHINFTKEGYLYNMYTFTECVLFPSKDQRDWSKFSAPWYEKERFDPDTLQPFDKVLVRDNNSQEWNIEIFVKKRKDSFICPYMGFRSTYECCIPYNNDTKHLLGTTDEAPEFYRYWED